MFMFACGITGTFNMRYCLAGTIGISGAIAWAFSRVPGWRLAIFPVLIGATFIAGGRFKPHLPYFVPPPEQLQGTEPIVIADALNYFQIMEAAPDALKKRLVYVNAPKELPNPDPTNENLIDRWHVIRPDLDVQDAGAFFAANPQFYLVSIPRTQDVLTSYLKANGGIETEAGTAGDAQIFLAHGPIAARAHIRIGPEP